MTVGDLYVEGGEYPLVSWRAMAALVAGVSVALVGLVLPPLRVLYDYAWFVGSATSAVVYLVVGRRRQS